MTTITPAEELVRALVFAIEDTVWERLGRRIDVDWSPWRIATYGTDGAQPWEITMTFRVKARTP